MKFHSCLLLVSILFSSPFSKPIDIVHTKDQDVYKGVITDEDSATVLMKLKNGSIIRIPQSDVLSIGRYADDPDNGYHQHDGFFFSANNGGGYGSLSWGRFNNKESGTAVLTGAGPVIDYKIGGALKENLILSFDLIMTPVASGDFSGKGMDVNGLGITSSPDSASDVFLGGAGLGLTYYFMPANIFLSGTLGVGAVALNDKYGSGSNYDLNLSTRYSEAFGNFIQLKVGKEWWVSTNWGLGISGAYFFFTGTEAAEGGAQDPHYTIDYSYKGSFSAHQFCLLFNATFN